MANLKNYRRALLQGTGSVLLASLGATGAIAADATIVAVATTGAADTSTSSGQVVINSPLFKDSATTATATGITGSITSSGTATGTFSVLDNTTSALASANIAASTVGLDVISSDALLDGIAVSSASLNTGAVNAYASNQTIAANLTGFESGAVAVTGNRVSATASINSTTQTIAGAAPIGYVSPAGGEATATVDADAAAAASVTNLAGTIVASTIQKSAGADSGAFVGTDGTTASSVLFNLALNGAANVGVTGSAALDNNAATAIFSANTATTLVDLGSADGSFAGTAAVGTAQVFDGNTTLVNALNTNTNVTASVTEATFDNTFNGSALSVASNRISATANGNTATDTISVADATAYAGSGTGNDSSLDVTSAADIVASGDLVIATSQQNFSVAAAILTATTLGADVTAVVENSVNSTVDVSLNQVSATTTANRLTSSVDNGTGSASFTAGVTLVGEQRNGAFFDVAANVTNANIATTVGVVAGAGVVSGSDVSMTGNVSAATATANTLRQTVALDATVLGLGGGVATASATTLGASAGVSADGAVTVGSVQISASDTDTTATNTNSLVTLTSNDGAGTNSGNALLVSTNTQEAFATGSSAANSVSLTGNSVGSEVAVVSLQQNLDTSSVVAALDSRAALVVAGDLGGTASATAEVSGNIARAVSTGVTVANTLNVDAQTVAVTASNTVASTSTYESAATNGQAFDNGADLPTVRGAYALLNDQTVLGPVSATATPVIGSNAFLVSVGGDVNAGSSVDNNRNTLAAQAQGTVAANSSTLDIATLSTTGFAPVAAVSNVQTVGDLGVSAKAAPLGAFAVVSTAITDDVTDASVATSGNAVLATTDATKSVNSLTVNSTTLTAIEGAAGTAGVVSVSNGVNTADAAFTVANAQATGTSSVVASLVDTAVASARISTTVGDAVSGSSIASSGNLLSALANANDTANRLTLSANSLQTTAGVLSAQISEAGVEASTLLGTSNAASSSRISVAVGGDISNSTIAVDSNVVQGSAIANVGTNALAVSATSIAGDGATTRASAGLVGTASTADADYVLVNDQQSNGGSSTAKVYNTFAIDQSNAAAASITGSSLSVSGNSQLGEAGNNFATNSVSISATDLDAAAAETSAALTSTQTGSATVSASSGVDVFSNIASSGSTIDMNSNVNTARGFFNSAANTLSVAGTNIASASAADANVTTGVSNIALADYALSNNQASTGNIFTFAVSSIFNSDGSDATTPGIANGSVSLSSNSNTATTTLNAGTNAVLVNSAASPGASVATVAALGNNQSTVSAAISDATARLTVEAFLNGNNTGPVAMVDDSTVALNGNVSRATSVLNTATNTLAVYGANIADVGTANTNAIANSATGSTVTADFAINNVQSASGAALSSNAFVTIGVSDAIGDAAGGVTGSDVSLSGNVARAESNANAASNSVVVSGDAQLGATAGLGNDQTNGVATSATSTASVQAFLDGLTTQNALSGSSLSVEGNTSTAVARGNTATNAMTYAAGANYGTSNVGATVTDTTSIATAAAVVLNAQNNTGNVTATGSGTYTADLTNNTGATGAGVLNSTVRVGGNAINAFAFGNSAVNSLVMTALNTGMPTAAVSSNQTNTAAIVASVSGSFRINGTGTVGSSSLAAIGNLVGAQAIGNSSTTIIIGR